MIGHPQGACGAAGVAATLLAMRDGFLPPTINLERADPACDLDYVPNQARAASVEHAVCNCIGFGSKNSALVVSQSRVQSRESRVRAERPVMPSVISLPDSRLSTLDSRLLP